MSLPTQDAHTKHPTDEVSGYAQKVHPLIAQKVSEFVSEGMTQVHEVKRALRQYVHTQFSQQYQCQPLPSDHAQQKWALCYRDDKFYAAVNTNNGVEALNKVLKYNYLPQNKNMTVSNLATLLVTTFLPESYQKYILTPELSDVRDLQSIQGFHTLLPSWKTTKCDPPLLVQNEHKVLTSTSCAYRYNARHI